MGAKTICKAEFKHKLKEAMKKVPDYSKPAKFYDLDPDEKGGRVYLGNLWPGGSDFENVILVVEQKGSKEEVFASLLEEAEAELERASQFRELPRLLKKLYPDRGKYKAVLEPARDDSRLYVAAVKANGKGLVPGVNSRPLNFHTLPGEKSDVLEEIREEIEERWRNRRKNRG